MVKIRLSKLTLVQTVLWITVYFSALALIYHIRWFIPFLADNTLHAVVPQGELPMVWFPVQIFTNLIFLYVSWLLLRLYKRYRQTGFFDSESIKVLNGVILSCLGLAVLGAVRIVSANFSEVHIAEWNSVVSVSNLLFRSFTRLLVFNTPQTIYLLLAVILWAVRQFVTTALDVRKENELFI